MKYFVFVSQQILDLEFWSFCFGILLSYLDITERRQLALRLFRTICFARSIEALPKF